MAATYTHVTGFASSIEYGKHPEGNMDLILELLDVTTHTDGVASIVAATHLKNITEILAVIGVVKGTAVVADVPAVSIATGGATAAIQGTASGTAYRFLVIGR